LAGVKAVAIKELKNRLSAYLREVQGGEVVLVTDRGRVVAELRQPSAGTPLAPHERAIDQLVAEGLLVREAPHDRGAYRPSPLPRAVATADLLDAERGER
jgi:antitoxin (DNA-binding transcriptional repressor) of toxin-antitoxin stability system